MVMNHDLNSSSESDEIQIDRQSRLMIIGLIFKAFLNVQLGKH